MISPPPAHRRWAGDAQNNRWASQAMGLKGLAGSIHHEHRPVTGEACPFDLAA